MNLRQDKYVRFKGWSSEKSSTPGRQFFTKYGLYPETFRGMVNSALEIINNGLDRISDGIQSFRKSIDYHFLSKQSTKKSSPEKKVFDPQGSFLQQWNKIILVLCVIAVSLDPLFFYIPVIDADKVCLTLDQKLEIIACVLRTFFDIFYVLHIVFQFRTGYIAPSSRVFGRGELIEDASKIRRRYLRTYFVLDFLAVLPLPQMVVILIIPNEKGSVSLIAKEWLKYVIFLQYIPRLYRIYPLYGEVTRTSGVITETAWAGAVLNLFIYMLASNVVGSFWYLFSIEREDKCWRDACKLRGVDVKTLYCGEDRGGDKAFLNTSCPFNQQDGNSNSTLFDFGIFLDALQSHIVESGVSFPEKFFYCFWWGLRNLSSLGQNLKTSTFVWEIIFAVFISIFGLVLFALLIGNMQKYLQSTTVRVEEMRVKRRDAERWMSHRLLPDHLRDRIRRYEQYKWQETRGVEEEALICNLPKDLRRDIKRHLCYDLLMKVPMFKKMDEQLIDAMCDRLKPALHTDKSFILREGDPVDEMLFVMRGNLSTVTTNGGRTGFFNSVNLNAGDFCGEELLTWALDPNSSSNLPISTRTVKALSEVEAFSLKADDLKFVATQYRRLHSKQLQHIFRFYSQQWKTWAACFIQSAWRRYCKRKLDGALREDENKLQTALAKDAGVSPSLGATIYASKFAANILRTVHPISPRQTRVSERPTPLLLQKPSEPDFTKH